MSLEPPSGAWMPSLRPFQGLELAGAGRGGRVARPPSESRGRKTTRVGAKSEWWPRNARTRFSFDPSVRAVPTCVGPRRRVRGTSRGAARARMYGRRGGASARGECASARLHESVVDAKWRFEFEPGLNLNSKGGHMRVAWVAEGVGGKGFAFRGRLVTCVVIALKTAGKGVGMGLDGLLYPSTGYARYAFTRVTLRRNEQQRTRRTRHMSLAGPQYSQELTPVEPARELRGTVGVVEEVAVGAAAAAAAAAAGFRGG